MARAGSYNTYYGQRSTGSSVSVTGPGGSSHDRSGNITAGPECYAHAGGGSTYSANTDKTATWDTTSVGNGR